MSDRQKVSTGEKCEHCGTTTLKFDPPLVFEPSEACGTVKPGTYGNIPGGIPVCEMPKGHEGKHMYLVEYLDSWSDQDIPTAFSISL